MAVIEAKDRDRIAVISSQPLEKQIVSATKMAKLITDPDKAERRWLAAVEKMGSDDIVTGIFRNRLRVLRGESLPVDHRDSLPAEPSFKDSGYQMENRIKRSKEDFPIGCNVKKRGEDEVGVIYSHEGFLDYLWAKFEGQDEAIPLNIYDIKRV